MPTTLTLTAMFKYRSEAERAAKLLASELHLAPARIRISPEAGATAGAAGTGIGAAAGGGGQAQPTGETGLLASLKGMFLPDEDSHAYAEGMRRGSVLLGAEVAEAQVDRASDLLEQAGAVDLDAQEAEWRKEGWTGYDAGNAAVPAGAAVGQDDTIKVVEERLAVGKREVERGRVRVRSYVVERPVEEQLTLHEERVVIDRRPVDRPADAADAAAAFQGRVIEATARGEEAVVAKEARVVEEIGVRKEAAEHVETVRDTVRKTEVEVEDAASAAGRGPSAGAGASASSRAGAVENALGTDVSGMGPGAKRG